MFLSIFYESGTLYCLAYRDGEAPLFKTFSLGLESPPDLTSDLLSYLRSRPFLEKLFGSEKLPRGVQESPRIFTGKLSSQGQKKESDHFFGTQEGLVGLSFPYVWFGGEGVYSSWFNRSLTGYQALLKTLARDLEVLELEEYLINRYLYPSYYPEKAEDFLQETNLAWLFLRLWRNLARVEGWPESLATIVFGGRFLTLTSSLVERLLPALETVPLGLGVELFFESGNFLPCLGALALVDNRAYEEVLPQLPLLKAATVFRAPGPLKVEVDFGWEEVGRFSLPAGSLAALPLSSKDSAHLAVRDSQKRLWPPFEVHGGEVGLIIDARSESDSLSDREELLLWRQQLLSRRVF